MDDDARRRVPARRRDRASPGSPGRRPSASGTSPARPGRRGAARCPSTAMRCRHAARRGGGKVTSSTGWRAWPWRAIQRPPADGRPPRRDGFSCSTKGRSRPVSGSSRLKWGTASVASPTRIASLPCGQRALSMFLRASSISHCRRRSLSRHRPTRARSNVSCRTTSCPPSGDQVADILSGSARARISSSRLPSISTSQSVWPAGWRSERP